MMKNSTKGALLSGLVFPGLGQVVLKRYRRGIVLMLVVLAGVSIIAVEAVQQGFAIVDKMGSTGLAPDMSTLSSAVASASAASSSPVLDLVQLLVVACWIFSIVDAYRIGRKKDEASAHPAPDGNFG